MGPVRVYPSRPLKHVDVKIAIVGEAPGKEEVIHRRVFHGTSGKELDSMLQVAGIDREHCYLTNVFWTRPINNDIEHFCVTKTELPKVYPFVALRPGKYFSPTALLDVTDEDMEVVYGYRRFPENWLIPDRLKAELEEIKPNIVIALGNTACWALLNQTKITKIRGAIQESTLIPGLKVMPTFHPAAILRNWSNRSVVIDDLRKAKQESFTPTMTKPQREIWINPTLEDIKTFAHIFLKEADTIAFDIETARYKQITCIGFSPNKHRALVIPFWNEKNLGYHYWPTFADELEAWQLVRDILALPAKKLAHNGIYDIQYLYKMGIPVRNYRHDTMILQHALQPELKKGLGHLASIYTNEMSWKQLRPRGHATNKENE